MAENQHFENRRTFHFKQPLKWENFDGYQKPTSKVSKWATSKIKAREYAAQVEK